jgi:hypothetical protein
MGAGGENIAPVPIEDNIKKVRRRRSKQRANASSSACCGRERATTSRRRAARALHGFRAGRVAAAGGLQRPHLAGAGRARSCRSARSSRTS